MTELRLVDSESVRICAAANISGNKKLTNWHLWFLNTHTQVWFAEKKTRLYLTHAFFLHQCKPTQIKVEALHLKYDKYFSAYTRAQNRKCVTAPTSSLLCMWVCVFLSCQNHRPTSKHLRTERNPQKQNLSQL